MHDAVVPLVLHAFEEIDVVADVDRRGLRDLLGPFDVAVDIVARDLDRVLEVLIAETNIERRDRDVVLFDELGT